MGGGDAGGATAGGTGGSLGGGTGGGSLGGGAAGGSLGGGAAGGSLGGGTGGSLGGGAAGGSLGGGAAGGSLGGGTGGSFGGGTGGSSVVAQVTAVLAAFDADAGFPSLPIDNVLVTYVPPVIDGGVGLVTDPNGFFIQAAPDGPAVFVGVPDAGVRAGDVVSFVATAGSRLFGLRQITSYTNFSRSSSNNPVSGYVRDVTNVDFTQNFDAWESRLVRVVGSPSGGPLTGGNGFRTIPLATAGVPDAGTVLRVRLPTPYFELQDFTPACQVVVTGTPLWRFSTIAQPLAFTDAELMGTTCPAPNLLQAGAPGAQVVLATFDRVLAPGTVLPSAFSIDAGASLPSPGVVSATLSGPRVVTLQTTALSQRPYELSCGTTVTDGRGRPVSMRTQPFFGAAPQASCSQVVISQVYPAGGNAGAVYNVDFVELRNRSVLPVSVVGWTLQYQSSGGVPWTTFATLGTIIPANGFLLITTGGTGTSGAPVIGDVTASQALAGTAAKIALVPNGLPLSPGCPDAGFADLVGYGALVTPCAEGLPAASPTTTTALSRGTEGCVDNDSNVTDFTNLTPNPRSSSYDGGNPCGTCN